MTFDDFMRTMLAAFPRAEVVEDNEGQLIVCTGLREGESGEVIPFEADAS